MTKTPFIWLGSRRAHKRGVDAKGALLDQAAAAGLPVPDGAVLLHDLYPLLLDVGLVIENNGRILIDSPQELHAALYQDVRFPRLNTPVVVRPAVVGCAASRLHVDFGDPAQLAAALSAIWSALHRHDPNGRKDVLVMAMVMAETVGTAVLHAADQPDNVIVEDAANPDLLLSPLGRWQRPASDLPPYAQRLQQLLRGVRRTFGTAVAQIDWIDDGQICWLVEVVAR